MFLCCVLAVLGLFACLLGGFGMWMSDGNDLFFYGVCVFIVFSVACLVVVWYIP